VSGAAATLQSEAKVAIRAAAAAIATRRGNAVVK